MGSSPQISASIIVSSSSIVRAAHIWFMLYEFNRRTGGGRGEPFNPHELSYDRPYGTSTNYFKLFESITLPSSDMTPRSWNSPRHRLSSTPQTTHNIITWCTLTRCWYLLRPTGRTGTGPSRRRFCRPRPSQHNACTLPPPCSCFI
jgi:hypothetical protein